MMWSPLLEDGEMTAAIPGRKQYRLLAVSFGLLCVLQAALNISLRLAASNSDSKTSDIEASLKTLTEERDSLKKELSDYDNIILNKDVSLKNLTEDQEERKRKLAVWIKKQCYGQGWTYFQDSLYYLSSTEKPWQESREDCFKKDADLMIINSEEEQRFTTQLKDNVWIGLTDDETEGTWKWVDGTPLNTSYWYQDEPNNFNGGEDCTEIRFHKSEMNWNDKPCHYKNFWVCEKKIDV